MSAPDVEPLSWRAIQWIKQVVGAISPDAGYYSDFTALGVLDDRSQIDAEAGAYVLVVATAFEPTGESGSRSRRSYSENMDVLVEFGVQRVSGQNPERALHRARADILRALRQDIRASDAGITKIEITGSNISDVPDAAQLIVAQVTARAGHARHHAREWPRGDHRPAGAYAAPRSVHGT